MTAQLAPSRRVNQTNSFNQLSGWLVSCLRKVIKMPKMVQHRYGYQYLPILCRSWLEILLLQWSAGDQSKPHSHKASFNLTRVASGKLLERKYHISGGKLMVTSERILKTGQWAWTLPFQVHELIVLDEPAETLHFYFPGR